MNQNDSPLQEIEVIGAGGLARDFYSCFRNEINITGFWDDGVAQGTLLNNIPVKGSVAELLTNHNPVNVIIMIANPLVRKQVAEKLKQTNHYTPTLIHSLAQIFDKNTVHIEKGCIVFPQTVITCNSRISEFSLIHIGCSIHHDSKIGKHCVLMPGARMTGNSQTGDDVYIGPNLTITNAMKIGNGERVEK